MGRSYRTAKGTFDILSAQRSPQESWRSVEKWQHLERVASELAYHYGYEEIRTPIFESVDLFVRGVGEGSDIVSKEIYAFSDKKDREWALRPEGTAPLVRAFIEHHLARLGREHKFYYTGPFFRYDRPQEGRYRQFHQFGAEVIGTGGLEQDFELIDMLMTFLHRLGLSNFKLLLNSLGDGAVQLRYQEALRRYLIPFKEELGTDSQRRLSHGVLRILDSKDPRDQELLTDAPVLLDFLDRESRCRFEATCELLEQHQIRFEVSPHLVRGLDYYDGLVFEVVTGDLGAQSSLGAGGRYDRLIKSLGGADLPGAGFSVGLERILLVMARQQVACPQARGPLLGIIPLGEQAHREAHKLLYTLRHRKLAATIIDKTLKRGLAFLSEKGGRFALVLGDQELERKSCELKELATGAVVELPLDDLGNYLEKRQAEERRCLY